MLGYRSRPFSALLEALGEVQVDIFEVTLFSSRVKIGLIFFAAGAKTLEAQLER